MDDSERAQLQIERALAAQLERAASMARQVLGHHATSTQCIDCHGPIEPARLTHGLGRCYACAAQQEAQS